MNVKPTVFKTRSKSLSLLIAVIGLSILSSEEVAAFTTAKRMDNYWQNSDGNNNAAINADPKPPQDTKLDDYDFPNHYPVQQELNYYLWYGLIPLIKSIGAYMYFFDSGFGDAESFVSSVLGGISSIGGNVSKVDDKNMHDIVIGKPPFDIHQRFQKDMTEVPRDFGPNVTDKGEQDPNKDTSWVLAAKATLTGGIKWFNNIPGFKGKIEVNKTTALDANLTKELMDVIKYDEHIVTKYTMISLVTQLQSKTNGSSSGNILSYWKWLWQDLIWSNCNILIPNPFIMDMSKAAVKFTQFIDDIVRYNVYRTQDIRTDKNINLSWGTSVDMVADQTATITLDSSGITSNNFYLINKAKGTDLGIRSVLSVGTPEDVILSNRPFDPSGNYNAKIQPMVKYKVGSGGGAPKPPTSINPFNYLFERAFLGVVLYSGTLPKWYEGNSQFVFKTSNYSVTDQIWGVWYKKNFIGNGKQGDSLYQKWINVKDPNIENYYVFMNGAFEDYYQYSMKLLSDELWSNPKAESPKIDIKESNEIIKLLKNNPDGKTLEDILKKLSEALVKYRDVKTTFNYSVSHHDWWIDIWNDYSSVVDLIATYLKIPSKSYNWWIILGVFIGIAIMLFICWAIYGEVILKHLSKNSKKLISKDKFENELK